MRNPLIYCHRLIAILLVVFGMSVIDVSTTFTKISEDLFSDPNMKPAERNAKLRVHIEELMGEYSIPPDNTLLDANQYSNECKL
jgi:hypothetical protein